MPRRMLNEIVRLFSLSGGFGPKKFQQPGCVPPWLTDEHLDAMQWFYDEARRLTKETGISHIVDHICPLNGAHSCGLHVPWNLQVLTDAANKRKRFREDTDF